MLGDIRRRTTEWLNSEGSITDLRQHCGDLAVFATHASANLLPLAEHIFQSAAEPDDPQLQAECAAATVELSRALSEPLRVQAFTALATTLPRLLINAVTMLREAGMVQVPERGFDEVLRLCGPAAIQFRRAAANLEIAGEHISQGELMQLSIYDANRDPDVFTNPLEFDFTRQPNPHLSLSAGVHACIGAQIVRDAGETLLSRALPLVELPPNLQWKGFAIRYLEQ